MTVNSNYSAYSSNSTSSVSSASQKGKPDFEKMAQELLSSLDTDKSGSIDKAEFSAAAQALASSSTSSTTTDSSSSTDIFSTLDTNSDGSMSTEELVASLKNMKPPEGKGNMPPPPPGGMPPPSDSSSTSESSSSSDIIDAMDTNKDGTVSIDELLAALENSKTDSSNKNNGTSSVTDFSTASSTSQTENLSQKFSDVMLKNILSYYGNNTSTTSSTSLLSISA